MQLIAQLLAMATKLKIHIKNTNSLIRLYSQGTFSCPSEQSLKSSSKIANDSGIYLTL